MARESAAEKRRVRNMASGHGLTSTGEAAVQLNGYFVPLTHTVFALRMCLLFELLPL